MEYQKQHYAANRENILERQKRHYAANREKKLEYAKQYHAANREKISAYRAANREKRAEYDKQNHEVRRQQALVIINPSLTCAWFCEGGCDGALEIDHIVPVGRRTQKGFASAGFHLVRWVVNNPTHPKLKGLQLLCNEHNRHKRDYSDEEGRTRWRKKFAKRHPQVEDMHESQP